MATTTPNFGWDIPQSTDLVKDGATAIAALGTDIDTALVDLKGGTTGQVLSKNSNTDLDFTWVAQDDSNAIQNAIVDAKGDLISATAADTPARLASSGVNGQVLTVDTTTATGLKWATPASAVTFTPRSNPDQTFYQIAYDGSSLYVAVGDSGVLYTSTNGTTWTSRTSGFGANRINSVAYGNGLWVAVGQNGTITTSSDGTTWTARTSNMSTNEIYAVTYANSLWVAVGDGGGTTNTGGITYSSDGLTWTRKSQSLTVGTSYRDVVWNGTNWIVGATVATNNHLYATAPSGTWTAAATGSGGLVGKIIWDGTRFITFEGNSGTPRYSTNTALSTTTQLKSAHYINASSRIIGRAMLYNGKVYVGGDGYIGTMTVDSTANPLVDPPFLAVNSITSGASGIGLGAQYFWIGAAGYIVASNGGIYSSF